MHGCIQFTLKEFKQFRNVIYLAYIYFIYFPTCCTHFQMIHKCNNKLHCVFIVVLMVIVFLFNTSLELPLRGNLSVLVSLLVVLLDFELLIFHVKLGSLGPLPQHSKNSCQTNSSHVHLFGRN